MTSAYFKGTNTVFMVDDITKERNKGYLGWQEFHFEMAVDASKSTPGLREPAGSGPDHLVWMLRRDSERLYWASDKKRGYVVGLQK